MRRQNHCRIARVNAGVLNMLEHASNHNRACGRIIKTADISDAIHIDFGGVLKKLVHQHWPLR